MSNSPLPTLVSSSVALGLVMGYHGYKRNKNSIGWGIGWYLFGATVPIVAAVVSLSQGYAKLKAG